MTEARWLYARAALRDYVRHTLYADLPIGTPWPPLRLPRLSRVGVTEEDVYASRPGAGDERFDEAGQTLGPRGIASGPATDNPTLEQAASADAGWRAYLERELADAPDAALEIDRATVLIGAERIGSRYWRAIYELGHRCNVKQVALTRQTTTRAVKAESAQALDELLRVLYRASERPSDYSHNFTSVAVLRA
ncbi:MAG: hypothetical protein ACYDHY_17355 [Acidiferrobacterales bacterium]